MNGEKEQAVGNLFMMWMCQCDLEPHRHSASVSFKRNLTKVGWEEKRSQMHGASYIQLYSTTCNHVIHAAIS